VDRGLRRQWEQALRRIPMPEPFGAVAFCELLGPHLGRELVLVPKASTGGPCGMVARTDTTDFIFYETATSWTYEQHNILHECGHLLGNHQVGREVPLDQQTLALAHLDPRRVRLVLARSCYHEGDEQEAEVIATLLGRRVTAPTDLPPLMDPGMRRVSTAFADEPRRGFGRGSSR